jgi:hypothetical protein
MTIQVTPADEACARKVSNLFSQKPARMGFGEAEYFKQATEQQVAFLIAARVAEAVKGERDKALLEAWNTINAVYLLAAQDNKLSIKQLNNIRERMFNSLKGAALQGKAEGGNNG